MFVRVVTLNCKPGAEDELRRIGRDILVPVNRQAGCENVYFLEPSGEDNNLSFGVVSVWENKELLTAMKRSNNYQDLLNTLSPLIDSAVDKIYRSN